jgi:phosphomannomutase/phosphoglucomutase
MTKNNKRKKSAADKKTSKPQNALLNQLVRSAILCLLVVSAAFTYIALVERPSISQASIEAQSQSLVDSQASLLDQALNQLRLRLSNIALSKELLTALEQKDQTVITRYRLEVARAFPEVISARLIELGPLGIASLNQESRQLRNNIELDLLRHVSNGENVEPEAYQYDGKWLFSLAEPIKAADKEYASGALLITLDEQYLRTLLGQLDSSLGQTKLIQQFKSKQHTIAFIGSADNNDLTASADTSISHWQIFFEPSAELVAQSGHNATILWSLLALSVITIIAAAAITLKSLQQTLISNLENLTKTGNKTTHSFSLPHFADTATKIQANLTQADSEASDNAVEKLTASVSPEFEEPLVVLDNIDGDEIILPESLPESIFRAYDIRGLAESELSDEVVYAIGQAIGSEALDQGQQSVIIAADGRHSSPRIHDAMVKGLIDSGRDVIDIGTQPTPLMYFATHRLSTQSGVMITGSHNPSEYNGIKIVIGGRALSGIAIQSLKDRITNKALASGQGQYQAQDIEQSYIDYIINDVAIAQPLKIVLDAGNGVAGSIAPRLFEELGCEVIPLYCEVDGDFPNHHPDPTLEENLTDLKRIVQEEKADLGIAFDGDGDRLGVVTATGQSVPADRLLMLLAQDVVSRNPGADVLFDVKCTRNLNSLISNYGGRPIMWKTGHSFMKEKMVETGALLGGEFSGHIFFKERWFGFDDGMYAAARLIEILSTTDPDLDLQLQAFPESIGSPELKVATSEEQKFSIIEQLIDNASFGEGKISTLDGVRVDFPDGWGLVRASNTTPMLVLRFEADTNEVMNRIQTLFKEQLNNIDSSLQFDF